MNPTVDHLLLFEFIYVEASDILDEKGRPLGESRCSPPVKEKTTFEKRQCPYRDSRYLHEKLMNVSPLKLMTKNWMKILEEVAVVRTRFQAYFGIEEIQLNDIWFLSGIGLYYPYFQLNKQQNPKQNGEISIITSSFYKVAIGMFQQFIRLFSGLIQEGENIAHFNSDTEFLYGYVDKNNLLVGAEEVCSGPINLIKQIIQEMLGHTLLKKTDAEMDKMLSEEEYTGLIVFTSQLLIVDLVNRVYKDIEGDLYTRMIQQLHENSVAEHPIQALDTLYNRLKERRFQDPNKQSTRADVFYAQVKELLQQMSRNDAELLGQFEVISQPKLKTDNAVKKQILNTLIEQETAAGNTLSQAEMLTVYQFIEIALEYVEREKALLAVLSKAEITLIESLGHSGVEKSVARKHLMDYNNYYFSEAFEQVFGGYAPVLAHDLKEA